MAVQWFFSGTWYEMNPTTDNYYVMTSINEQALILPAQIKITSVFGQTVIDTIPTSKPIVRPNPKTLTLNPKYSAYRRRLLHVGARGERSWPRLEQAVDYGLRCCAMVGRGSACMGSA